MNENLVQETAPVVEGAIDPEDEMPLDGMIRPRVYHTPPHVGPTLVSLGNTRRNTVRRPSRHHMVVQNNCTIYGRRRQSSIPCPCSANNGGMACTE